MKILAFSDTHFKTSDPYNIEHLKLKLLKEVLAYWGPQVDVIVHLADNNDSYGFSSVLASKEAQVWSVLGSNISKAYVLMGNHDQDQKKFIPILPFSLGTGVAGKGMTVVGETPVVIGNIAMRGFSEEPIKDIAGVDYFFGHLAIDYEAQGYYGVPVSDYLASVSFKRSFFGDIHTSYDLDRVVSVGTMFPTSFRDQELEAQYMIIDSETGLYERRTLDFPQFWTFDIKDQESFESAKLKVKGNICRVRVHCDSTPEQRDEMYSALLALGPYYLEKPVPVTEGRKDHPIILSQPAEPLAVTIERYATSRNWGSNVKEFALGLISGE